MFQIPTEQYQPALPPINENLLYLLQPKNLFNDITWAMQMGNRAPLLLNVQAALAVGALVLQTQVSVERPNDGEVLPVSQLIIGIADSGERKSGIVDGFMAPVTVYLKAQKQKQIKAWQQYDEDIEVWRKTFKRFKDMKSEAYADRLMDEVEGEKISQGRKKKELPSLESIERSIERLKQKEPIPPKQASIGILSDATPQAIPKFIKEQRVRSLGIVTAEGEEILTNGIKHKSSILNKGYSGEASQRYRVGEGDQSYDIPITVCIYVQPNIALNAFGGSDAKMRGTGTLARALVAFPASTQGTRLLQVPDDSNHNTTPPLAYEPTTNEIKTIKKHYSRWVSDKMYRADKHSEDKRIKMILSREAQTWWHRGFNECETSVLPDGRYVDFRDHASKLPDQWLRVATIIHCYNNGLAGEISLNTLKTAISWVNAFSAQFTQLFPTVSKEDKEYLTLQNYLNEKRQMCRYLPKSIITSNGPLRPVSRLNIALEKMHQQGGIHIGLLPRYTQTGRPTKPLIVIDLFPQQPHNDCELHQSVQQAYRISQL
ncbi:DUF3987 domain-containing protein [Vreelandella venusta]